MTHPLNIQNPQAVVAHKDDASKLLHDLVLPEWHNGLAEVMTFGATKYEPNSCRNAEPTIKVYMGVDVGSKGYLALHHDGSWEYHSIADIDTFELSKLFADIKQRHPNIVCVIESVHALFNSAASATFSFGEIFGALKAFLIANNIPFHLVQPKVWQKEMWRTVTPITTTKVTKTKDKKTGEAKEVRKVVVDTKATSILAAKSLFPDTDFRRSERCKNIDDNKVDATLMAEYARRMNF